MPIRFLYALSLCSGLGLCGPLPAQKAVRSRSKPISAVPINPPTPLAAATAFNAPSAPLTPAERPPHRAVVTYSQGQLAVIAENSSLNQILREIARETGIKITGGVADERVFGTYGPSPAPDVLAALLDGTGSNLLLIPSDSSSPGELVLTPRRGGVTPPNPNAPSFEDDSSDDSTLFKGFQPINQAAPPSVAAPPPATPAATPAAGAVGFGLPATAQPVPAVPDGSESQSPNAVKTPQQIYEQLQRLQQQRSPTAPQ